MTNLRVSFRSFVNAAKNWCPLKHKEKLSALHIAS